MSDTAEKKVETEESSGSTNIVQIIRMIIYLIMVVSASKLSWGCNVSSHTVVRVFYALMAMLFAPLYLTIYLIFLRGKCKA